VDLHESSADDISDTVPRVPDSVQAACESSYLRNIACRFPKIRNSDPRYIVALALAFVHRRTRSGTRAAANLRLVLEQRLATADRLSMNPAEPPCREQRRGLEDLCAKTKKNRKMCKSKSNSPTLTPAEMTSGKCDVSSTKDRHVSAHHHSTVMRLRTSAALDVPKLQLHH